MPLINREIMTVKTDGPNKTLKNYSQVISPRPQTELGNIKRVMEGSRVLTSLNPLQITK